jgi:hypothetical protein
MRTRLTLHPGQRGTKRLPAQYGDRLVCVRYRYDAVRSLRLKTVELVVSERPWVYCKPFGSPLRPVLIAVPYADRALRLEVKKAGGVWNPDAGAWELPYDEAARLGIEGLVVVPGRGRRAGRRRGAASSDRAPGGAPPSTSICREEFPAYVCIGSTQ